MSGNRKPFCLTDNMSTSIGDGSFFFLWIFFLFFFFNTDNIPKNGHLKSINTSVSICLLDVFSDRKEVLGS